MHLNKYRSRLAYIFIFLVIYIFAAILRTYGLNWDSDQHLHPDERFLTMVTLALKWPKDLTQYLDASTSPLNPHNVGFGFFVYGLFPLTLTKWVAQNMDKLNYNDLTIVGRQLSALFDIGTVVLVFLIAEAINSKSRFRIFPLVAMFLYAAMVLPIQLSHFFAVDTFLTFFITLSFYLVVKLISCFNSNSEGKIQNSKFKIQNYSLKLKTFLLTVLLGLSFGLALASKITAILFLPIMVLLFLTKSYFIVYSLKPVKAKIFNFLYAFLIFNILFLISSYLTFRLANPYTFANPSLADITLNSKVLGNWKELESFNDVKGGFPPAVQWITTKPFLFPAKNILFWGLGLPMGVIALLAIGYRLWVVGCGLIKRKFSLQLTTYNLQLNLMLLWILIVFVYQGMQFAKPMRYFYPMYPFLAILGGYFLTFLLDQISNIKYKIYKSKIKNIFDILYVFLIFTFLSLILLYPLSFLAVYSRPHSRVAASDWIYRNIPSGATLSGEHWDDYLPLSLPFAIKESYNIVEFPLYGTDTREKWSQMNQRLAQTDYIILSSNRLYGSIMTVPQKYPVTARYYRMLFDGSLGFEKVAEFTSRPNLPIPGMKLCLTPPFVRYGIVALPTQECELTGISFVDDYADESFTVYDHPKVVIFKKIRKLDYLGLLL